MDWPSRDSTDDFPPIVQRLGNPSRCWVGLSIRGKLIGRRIVGCGWANPSYISRCKIGHGVAFMGHQSRWPTHQSQFLGKQNMKSRFVKNLTASLSLLVFSPYGFTAEPEATPAAQIQVLDGFQVERLYSVPFGQQGSWVSMTVDLAGRLITSDQNGKLYRVTLNDVSQPPTIEAIPANIGRAHGLLYAFDSLYVMVNGKGSGLYRVRDSNGDDQLDDVQQLIAIRGGGEHGPHAIILSPDGKSLYFCAGNHTDVIEFNASRVPRVWSEDHLLGRMWDARGHAAGKLAPGGWIVSCDPDGRNVQLISNGYRNAYDIALNRDGELFTFDADMEWDIGTPWYRPTRVNHVVSGSEFGWRSGTGKWPEYYPDSLPAAVDIGPGSPTGIVFGTGAKFPAKYQQALYAADWSFGKIYAVHLTPHGASYRGTFEQFVAASPLPVTDLVVRPQDGALYFTIGGRGTQSGLYRVSYVGKESTEPVGVTADAGAVARAVRRRLESYHGRQDPAAVEYAWPQLGSKDRFIRYAARIAIEHQPVETWQARALSEADPQRSIEALIALARHGNAAVGAQVVAALNRISFGELAEETQLALLRAYALAFVRLGAPDDASRVQVIERLAGHYPSRNRALNAELCQLLVYLQAPNAIDATLALITKATTQEERIHYLLSLRSLPGEWSRDQLRRYFEAFRLTAADRGGASFGGFLRNIRNEAKKRLSATQQESLGDALASLENKNEHIVSDTRPVVKQWTLDELVAAAEQGLVGRDFERGREMFAAAACFRCHRLHGTGGISGPDLSGVGGRFSTRNLLESIVEPSRVISDQYQATRFVLRNGREIIGRIVNLGGGRMTVNTNMLDPNEGVGVKPADVEEMTPSKLSPMPTGLLNTLTLDEILDLLAYLRSGGDSEAVYFTASRAGG